MKSMLQEVQCNLTFIQKEIARTTEKLLSRGKICHAVINCQPFSFQKTTTFVHMLLFLCRATFQNSHFRLLNGESLKPDGQYILAMRVKLKAKTVYIFFE